MYQVPATVWNDIAAKQKLATPWAKRLFPTPPDKMDGALEQESKSLAAQGVSDPSVRSSFLQMAPLLWEREAIAKHLQANSDLTQALPNVEDAQEATMLASQDRPLNTSSQAQLTRLLETPRD